MDHPDTMVAVSNLGYLHKLQGKPAEAELHYRDVLETLIRVLGEEHRDTRDSVQAIVEFYEAWAEAAQGKGHEEQAARWKVLIP